jgi:hypothetical protein
VMIVEMTTLFYITKEEQYSDDFGGR